MFSPRRLLAGLLALVAITLLADASPSPWRPFSVDSPWNQPIAAAAPTNPDSRAMIDDFASRGPLHINIKTWSVPVYFVDADATPKHDAGDSRPGIHGAGFEFPRRVPIPDDAVASPPVGDDSDNHLCIVDKSKGLEWGMWAARKDKTGRWFTGLGAVTNLAGTGVAPPWFAAARQLDSHRARASGFPLIAGLMLVDEIKAGHIDHALVFAYDHCRTGVFVPPASTAQVTVPGTANFRGIPMGGRIQLDPSWDVEHSGLSNSGKIIARALQRYGAFCGDYAGANVIYAENSPAAVQAWEGLLRSEELEAIFTRKMIRWHFRVLDFGNILPGQNFELPPPYVVAFSAAGENAPARIDQLARTITIYPPRATARVRVHWILHPRASHVELTGREITDNAEIGLAPETTLALTAPDGAHDNWRLLVASGPAPR